MLCLQGAGVYELMVNSFTVGLGSYCLAVTLVKLVNALPMWLGGFLVVVIRVQVSNFLLILSFPGDGSLVVMHLESCNTHSLPSTKRILASLRGRGSHLQATMAIKVSPNSSRGGCTTGRAGREASRGRGGSSAGHGGSSTGHGESTPWTPKRGGGMRQRALVVRGK